MNSDDTPSRVPPSPRELKEIIRAERAGAPFLLWRIRDGHQRLLTLQPDRWRVVIGRGPGADVSLDWDREVSPTHALLERVGSAWTLIDDGLSRNGSFVNGARVIGRRRLAERDRICVGVTELTYREPSSTGSDLILTEPPLGDDPERPDEGGGGLGVREPRRPHPPDSAAGIAQDPESWLETRS